MYHTLVKSGVPIAPDSRYCAQCIDSREAKRQMRKTSRESMIVEGLDRKVQSQEKLREDAQDVYRLEELPARINERKGLAYSYSPSEVNSLGASNSRRQLSNTSATSSSNPVNTHVRQLKEKGDSPSEKNEPQHPNKDCQHCQFPDEAHENRKRGRERLLLPPGRRPDGITKWYWAAIHASTSDSNGVNLESTEAIDYRGESSSGRNRREKSLSNVSMEHMQLATTDCSISSSSSSPTWQNEIKSSGSLRHVDLSQSPSASSASLRQSNPEYAIFPSASASQKHSPSTRTSLQGRPDNGVLSFSPPKWQRSSTQRHSDFPPNSEDDIFSTGTPTKPAHDHHPKHNFKVASSVLTDPSTSPIRQGISNLFFALNPSAEAKMTRDLGFAPTSPRKSLSPQNRRRRSPATSSPTSWINKYEPKIRSPLSKSFSAAADTSCFLESSVPSSPTPFSSPGNAAVGDENNLRITKRKRSKPKFRQQDKDVDMEDGEEELFIPSPTKLAEAQERMKQYGGWSINNDVSPTPARELPQDGIARRMSELDAMFEADGGRVVEVNDELAEKLEECDEE
ncbi:hypothetical protein B0T21DRAFT_383563 [Apiosordaria backusii]|uniref:Uncharacterized protein n=1 Tax=Apiosordaria backusii TaxID=314023 RepID=A0AA40EDN7_9PEZI|nr:hypothetical protein B0T21DRAFT_383563 [Apiosordaria backusii]